MDISWQHRTNILVVGMLILWFLGGFLIIYISLYIGSLYYAFPVAIIYLYIMIKVKRRIGHCPRCGKDVFRYSMKWIGIGTILQEADHVFAPRSCPSCGLQLNRKIPTDNSLSNAKQQKLNSN